MSRSLHSKADAEGTLRDLSRLFAEQRFAALATCGESGAYASLVGFAATDDLKALLFCTPRTTKKFANLLRQPAVALLVDNSANAESDVAQAMAATATGRCVEVPPPEREQALGVYLRKNPCLSDFARSPNCALMRIEVAAYHVVRRFQDVVEVSMAP